MWELLLAAILAAVTVETPAPPSTLAALPRGAPPSVGYVAAGEWRGPDGRRVELPARHGISAVTPYAGGFLVADTRYFEMSLGLVQIDAGGRVVGEWTSSGSPVTVGDRTAWTSFVPPESGLTGPSLVHIGDRDGTVHTLRRRSNRILWVAGFTGGRVVLNDPATGVTLLDCTREVSLRRLGHAFDATDRWVAGGLNVGRRGSGVVDPETGTVMWHSRADGLTFSPSGRRVVGATREGLTVFRSSDGSVLWRAELPRRAYTGPLTWEDERHILAVTQLREETAVLRFGRGAAVERATRVRPSDFNRPPYVLVTQ